MANYLAIRPVDSSPSRALAAEPVRGHSQGKEGIHGIAPHEPEAVEPAGGDHDADDGPETSAKGVIRLLEAGHFRGVADVRLRINFHDELQARREEAARPAIAQAGDTFTTAVTGGISDVIASLGLEDGQAATLLDPFTGSVDSALADFSGNTAAVEQSLRDAFGALLALLQASVEEGAPAGSTGDDPSADGTASAPIDPSVVDVTGAPDATNVPDVTPTAPDTTGAPTDTTPAPTLDESLASLQGLFNTALTQLLNELDAAFAPPEPSAPNGNGAAYDRFLAQYLDLYGAHDSINTIA